MGWTDWIDIRVITQLIIASLMLHFCGKVATNEQVGQCAVTTILEAAEFSLSLM